MTNAITVGRLTPEFITMFCEIVSHGNYITTACKLMRVEESTFRSWMLQGKKSESGIYRELYERVLQADGAAESFALEIWRGHYLKDSKAAKDFLARRYPDRWSERRYIKLAVDREVENMLKALQARLPEDIFSIVIRELVAIEEEQTPSESEV